MKNFWSLKPWRWLITPDAIRLWWLERQINRDFAAQIKEANSKNDKDAISQLEYNHWFTLTEIHDSRLARIQQKWIRKAEKLMIPVPPQNTEKIFRDDDENWEYSRPTNEILLKSHAMIKLRSEVRREQKERRDVYSYWITIIVGLVGALTGLASVLMR